jgi:trigger factor
MKATVEAADGVFRNIKIELPWTMVEEELERAYKELAKEANLKGFRPGKVPRSVLMQRFGKKVENDVTARLIQDSYEAAMIQNKLFPVSRPEVQPGMIIKGQPLSFSIRVEVRPEIDLKNYKGFQLERKEPSVDQTAVDEEINRLREQKAVLIPIEGRQEARVGDTAAIDYLTTLNGKLVKEGESKDYLVELGAKRTLPGFEDAITGMSVGQSKEFDLDIPPDATSKDLAGKRVHFKVTLNALKQREVPVLNDEFVTDLGNPELKNVADLRAMIEKRVFDRERMRLHQELSEKLIDLLIEANPFPVPPSMVENQYDVLKKEMENFFQSQGVMLGNDERLQGEMHSNLQKRAEREVRSALLISAVAEREKLKVDDADIESHLQKLAEKSGQNMARLKALYQEPQLMNRMRYHLLQEKVLDYLLDPSNIKETSEAATGPASPAGPPTVQESQ